MATGEITTWGGNVTDIGPMYPFVGTETMMVVIGIVLWVVWHIWQLRLESREFAEDAERLRRSDTISKVLEREG